MCHKRKVFTYCFKMKNVCLKLGDKIVIGCVLVYGAVFVNVIILHQSV